MIVSFWMLLFEAAQIYQAAIDNVLELSENDKLILTIVHDNPTLTQREYALELGWTVDRVKYYLRKMKKQKVINRVGSSHNGYWKLLIDEKLWQG